MTQKVEAIGMTLADIVENPTPKTSCVGVILDATGAYKTYDSIDYVTKLKIIDNTFNYKDNETNYKSFIHVFIYSDTPEVGPRTNRVGDIIKLTNFDVDAAHPVQDLPELRSQSPLPQGAVRVGRVRREKKRELFARHEKQAHQRHPLERRQRVD